MCLYRVSRRILSMLSTGPEVRQTVLQFPCRGYISPFPIGRNFTGLLWVFKYDVHSGLDTSFSSCLGTCRCILSNLMHSLYNFRFLRCLWTRFSSVVGGSSLAHLCLCLRDFGRFTRALVSEDWGKKSFENSESNYLAGDVWLFYLRSFIKSSFNGVFLNNKCVYLITSMITVSFL